MKRFWSLFKSLSTTFITNKIIILRLRLNFLKRMIRAFPLFVSGQLRAPTVCCVLSLIASRKKRPRRTNKFEREQSEWSRHLETSKTSERSWALWKRHRRSESSILLSADAKKFKINQINRCEHLWMRVTHVDTSNDQHKRVCGVEGKINNE